MSKTRLDTPGGKAADSCGATEQAQFIAWWEPLCAELMGQDFGVRGDFAGIGQFSAWQHESAEPPLCDNPRKNLPSKLTGPEKLRTASKTQAWKFRATLAF